MRSIYILMLSILLSTGAFAKEDLPFWTEKSTYLEGDKLYAVGISEPNPDQAKARVEAQDRAITEVQNYFQLTDIKALTIETQMIHEVQEGPNWKVYRLVYVDHKSAMGLKHKQVETQVAAIRNETVKNKEQAKHLEAVVSD